MMIFLKTKKKSIKFEKFTFICLKQIGFVFQGQFFSKKKPIPDFGIGFSEK